MPRCFCDSSTTAQGSLNFGHLHINTHPIFCIQVKCRDKSAPYALAQKGPGKLSAQRMVPSFHQNVRDDTRSLRSGSAEHDEPSLQRGRDISHRFRALESWRGICAMAVALFHFSGVSHIYALVRHGGLGVEFFFVLSGFVMMHAYGHRLGDSVAAKKFVIRRFGRLYPLHLSMLLVMVVLETIKLAISTQLNIQSGEPPFSGTNSLPALAANLVLLNGVGLTKEFTWNGPSWSISAEFVAYFLFMSICLMGFRVFRFISIVIILAAATAALKLSYSIISGGGLLICLFGFFLGTQVNLFFRFVNRRKFTFPAWVEWLALIGIIAVFGAEPAINPIVASLVFAFAVFVFAFESGKISQMLITRVPLHLGVISYSIYLVHFPIITAMNGGARALQGLLHWKIFGLSPDGRLLLVGSGPWEMDLFLILFIAIVLISATITYRYVEEPCRNFFNKLSSKLDAMPESIPARASADAKF
jgi:peptidoglycan/LPS O-acetylase OafA/YrhL